MKKAIAYWFTLIIGILIFSFFLISCKAKQPPVKEITKEVSKTTDHSIEINNTLLEKSLASNDSLKLLVAKLITGNKECDSLCNEQFQKWLEQFNVNKKSGNNEQGVYYDKLNNLFVLYQKQGETINQLNEKLKESAKTITIEKKETKHIPVKYIPKWIQYLAIFGGLSAAFFLFKIVSFFRPKLV